MIAHEGQTGYKVWGVDDIVYGPVELPTLVTWIKEERVNAATWIFNERAAAWQRASEAPELNMFFDAHKRPTQTTDSNPAPLAKAGVKPGALRRIKIFAGMSDKQLEAFIDYMEVHPVRQWTEIVKQGDPGDSMYFVLEGEVRVRFLVAGRETILATLPAGEFFGEISLFDHGPRSADVVANTNATLLKISAAAFQKLAAERPDLAAPFLLAIGRTLTGRIRADNKRLRDAINFARASGI